MAESAHDDEVGRDERIARLQQRLYGPGSSASERAGAAAELASLQSAAPDQQPVIAGEAADGSRTAATSMASAARVQAAPSSRPRTHELRWVIGAAAAALAVGLAIGWQLGGPAASATDPTPSEAPLTATAPALPPDISSDDEAAGGMVEVVDAPMTAVFDRAATDADLLDPAWAATFELDAASVRLLLSRPDGLLVYGATRGAEICLIALYPAPAGIMNGTPTCSSLGMVDSSGLRVIAWNEAAAAQAVVHWRPNGTVKLGEMGSRQETPPTPEYDPENEQ
ncbi:hypothetical protein [Agromyces subbeticus]|uniref:hypothetical protein n=1 Tax=Agromyces subbeticus TaxID=293890 RepID=UPI0003B2FDA8|nr:hypothetical protein [Agromyces subbeticus]